MTTRRFQPGDRVRLTGRYLRSTGQYLGPEGQSRWEVIPCACELCASGRFVATNEPARAPYDGARHFAASNLERASR